MAWGFRKSVGFGGLRFTFSKSGVSTSFGGRGFRVTSSPRGVYVTTGAHGFYYRQRIGGGYTAPRAPRPTPPSGPTTTYESADVAVLSDLSQADFVRSLNEWTHRGVLQVVTFALAAAAILLLGGLLGAAAALEAFLYSIVVFAFVRYVEQRRRRFVLVYDLPSDARAQFGKLEAELEPLLVSWIKGVQASQYHGDWKRHGGATSAIREREATIGRAVPPLIVSNLQPISISTSGTSVFFLPDRVLVQSKGTYAALSYESMQAEWHESQFVWDDWSLPPGAAVIGRTWLYKNRSGGPDRRFKNNRELPEIRMGYLKLASETGLNILIQSTNIDAVRTAAEALAGYATSSSPSPREDASRYPAEVLAALRALGLATIPSKQDLRKHYLELATRTHPDKLGHAGRDVRMLAEERMKEINAAYATLRALAKGAPPPEEPLDLAPAPVDAPLPWWKQPTTIAAVTAFACCIVIFVGFRALPVEALIISKPVPSAVTPVVVPQQTRSFTTAIPRACTVRTEPSGNAAPVVSLPARASVAVLEAGGSWRKVATLDGFEGWTGPACWRPLRTSGQACRSNADCVSAACRENETGRACR